MLGIIYTIVYLLSWVLHIVAFYWAMKTWSRNDQLFVNSRVTSFFKSPIEREFFAVVGGMFGNLAFVFVKPFYIYQYDASITGWQEPFWAIGHISIGVALVIWHHKAYYDLEDYRFETGLT